MHTCSLRVESLLGLKANLTLQQRRFCVAVILKGEIFCDEAASLSEMSPDQVRERLGDEILEAATFDPVMGGYTIIPAQFHLYHSDWSVQLSSRVLGDAINDIGFLAVTSPEQFQKLHERMHEEHWAKRLR